MGITTLLLLVIIVGGISFLVARLNNTKKNRHGISYIKRVQWIFGGYFCVLLISVSLAEFVPEQGITAGNQVDSKVLEKDNSDIHVAALEGKIEKLDSTWKRKVWRFDYQGTQLNIVVPSDGSSDVMIVAERKEINDNSIEAGPLYN